MAFPSCNPRGRIELAAECKSAHIVLVSHWEHMNVLAYPLISLLLLIFRVLVRLFVCGCNVPTTS